MSTSTLLRTLLLQQAAASAVPLAERLGDSAPQPTLATVYSLADDPLARCLNGAPASVAAYLNASSTVWVIQFGSASPGLPWCISEAACKLYATPPPSPPPSLHQR